MVNLKTTTFADGFTVSVAQRVTVASRNGTFGQGIVRAISEHGGMIRVHVQMDEGTEYSQYDRYTINELVTPIYFDRILDQGVYGGELVR